MLLTSVRVSPWSDLSIFVSVGRTMVMVPSSCSSAMRGGSWRVSDPLGPLTVSTRPSSVTSTPSGTVMGRRPIRDIGLPDVREDLAAQLGLAGLAAGHDPLGRADDDDAEAAEHARDVRLARVHAQAGLADPLEPRDDRHLAVDVLQLQAQHLAGAVALLADVGDEAFLHEDPRDLSLGARRGNDDLGVARPGRVADAGEHVRDRVGDVHGPTSSTS